MCASCWLMRALCLGVLCQRWLCLQLNGRKSAAGFAHDNRAH